MGVYRRIVALAMAAPICLWAIAAGAQGVALPSLVNPHLRLDAPDLRASPLLRFLTTDADPPFNFALPDGSLAGYNVDLARAVCLELKLACTIQARPLDALVDALSKGEGDAVAASVPPNADARARLAFSTPYLPSPARFATKGPAKRDEPVAVSPAALAGRAVGVVGGSAHAAFLQRLFPAAKVQTFANLPALEDALLGGAVEFVFADGADLSFWLNGTRAAGCCVFAGGPYLDPALFGPGHAIALRPTDDKLRRAFDWALMRLQGRGALAELYLRYFPVALF